MQQPDSTASFDPLVDSLLNVWQQQSQTHSNTQVVVDEDVQDVLYVIAECREEKSQLTRQLAQLQQLHYGPVVVQGLDQLYDSRFKIQYILDESQELSDLIGETYELAESVSRRVRELDRCYDKVKRVLDVVESYIDLKKCVSGAYAALREQNYEKAAEHVSRVLQQRKALAAASLSSAAAYDVDENQETTEDYKTFKFIEAKVKEYVKTKFYESVEKNSIDDIRRYAKLFGPLGLEYDGLWIYVQFLVKEKENELRKLLDDALPYLQQQSKQQQQQAPSFSQLVNSAAGKPPSAKRSASVTYVDLLTEVLDIVAACIEQQEQFALREFSSGAAYDDSRVMTLIIDYLYTICANACGRIFDSYVESRYLKKIVDKTRLPVRAGTSSAGPQDDLLDPKNLDLLLEEITIICSRCEMYDRFVRDKVEQSSQQGSTQQQQRASSSALVMKLQELIALYVPIDEFFLRNGIKKALYLDKIKRGIRKIEKRLVIRYQYAFFGSSDDGQSLDGLDGGLHPDLVAGHFRSNSRGSATIEQDDDDESSDEDDNLYFGANADADALDDEDKCSTAVDDTFFILQRGIAQILRSLNMQAIGAMLNHLSYLMGETYRRELCRPLDALAQNRTLRYDPRTFVKTLVAINNLDISANYTVKLKEEFEHSIDELAHSVQDKERLRTSAYHFTSTSDTFKHDLYSCLKRLFSSNIEAELLQLTAQFDALNYNLAETEYLQFEQHDPLVYSFIDGCDEILSDFESILSQQAFDLLLYEFVYVVVQRLERSVLGSATHADHSAATSTGLFNGKPFSYLGGLKFDKDVRQLLLFFSGKTHTTVRDKFSRLTQLASLLKMQKVYEVLEYWGEKSIMVWRLTPHEVRQALHLRRDFNPEAIQRLKL